MSGIMRCFLWLALLLAASSSVSAADIYVDGVAGTDGVECGTKEWPCASLNAALVLKATQDDVVIVSGPLSGPLNSGFDIRGPRKLTIKSHPALTSPVVVTCNAGFRFMKFIISDTDTTSSTLAISGMEFKGCGQKEERSANFEDGGVLLILVGSKTILPSISIEDCIFDRANANRGGAVYALGSVGMTHERRRSAEETFAVTPILTMRRCTIKNQSSNGALNLNRFSTQLFDSTVTNNTNGAIIMSESTIVIERTQFTSNKANAGSVFYGNRVNVMMTDCIVRDNNAFSGATMYTFTSIHFIISGGIFEDNVCSEGCVWSGHGKSDFVVVGATIRRNKANRGGALLVQSSTVAIYNSTLTKNEAGNGGAIYNGAYGIVKLYNTMFEENTAYLGGGIFSKDADVTLLAGATFSKNSAKSAGAAIYCDASSFDVKDVTFVSNKDAFGADTNFACSASTSLRCYIISANKQWNGMCDDKFTPVGGDSDSGINLGNLPIPTWAAILIAVGCLLFIGVIGFVLTVVVYRRCYGRDLLNAHRPLRTADVSDANQQLWSSLEGGLQDDELHSTTLNDDDVDT